MNEHLKTSSTMALIVGIFVPLAESVRRIEQIMAFSHFFHWFDDYILGALLVVGALHVRRNTNANPGWLIAVWGMAAGALFLSLTAHLQFFIQGEEDPGIFPSWLVLLAKFGILVILLMGLWLGVKGNRV